MRVSEIFKSLQGEGPDAGVPAVFLRLTGCNLGCTWCDTKYALVGGQEEIDYEVVRELRRVAGECRYAIITGGEPLFQEPILLHFIHSLSDFHFAIETNGTLPRPPWWRMVIWDVDCKCPSSEVNEPFLPEWWSIGRKNRVKFVVADEKDLMFVVHTIASLPSYNHLTPTILISPCIPIIGIDVDWARRVWGFCVEHNLRYSLQVHKVVWGNRKGV